MPPPCRRSPSRGRGDTPVLARRNAALTIYPDQRKRPRPSARPRERGTDSAANPPLAGEEVAIAGRIIDMSRNETPFGDMPRQMSIQQAAEFLGVDPKTIRRYIAQGRIRAFRVGPRLIRIERESLERLAQPVGGVR